MKVYLNEKKIREKIIFITGAGRSGKTTISRILASCEGVEWIEEPYELAVFIRMYALGLISSDAFTMLFNSSVHELINSIVLLRNANFRPNDLSSIWRCKSAAEIIYRLHDVNTRDDVIEYIEKKQTKFIIDIPGVSQYIPLINNRFSSIKTINLIRNGYDVADSCFKKGWFAEGDNHNELNGIYKDYNRKKIPIWVNNGDEEFFLLADGYERTLMYWTQINENLLKNNDIDYSIRYEDLCEDPRKVISHLSDELNIKPTSITAGLCEEMVCGYDEKLDLRNKHYKYYNKDLFDRIMEKYGYEHE